jgi:hypothetical protein
MTVRRLTHIFVTIAVLLGVAAPVPALAATDVFKDACTNAAAKSSAVCAGGQTSTNPLTGSNGLIVKITRVIAYVSGVVAVIIIMISGLRYINSGGDPAKATQARNGIIYALAGLIVIISAQFIISLVMSRI